MTVEERMGGPAEGGRLRERADDRRGPTGLERGKITFGDFEALTSEVDGADGRPDAHDPEIGPPP